MATMMTIFDDSAASMVYYPDTKILHHTLHKPLESAELRRVLNTGVTAFKEHGAHKWLSDDRKNGPTSPEDGEWANNDWFPRVLAAGWKYWALVVPDDMMARLNMSEFVESYFQRGIRIMVFTDPNDAMDWLINVDK